MDERRRQKALARRKRKSDRRNELERQYRSRRQRTCGGCKLCCYVYCVPELGKERRQWCKYVCREGCSLHEQPRPAVCTTFRCLWLAWPEIPDRYRPDRIGCVAFDRGNGIAHLCQQFKGAARRPEAARFIDLLADAGMKVLVSWEQGEEREYRVRYTRRLHPTPPTPEEMFYLDPDGEKLAQDIALFERTGQSPRLWQGEQPLAGQ